jgi:hypothetical protein
MTFTPISIPNKQYQWNVDDADKGDIGEDGVFTSKDKEGYASILGEKTYTSLNILSLVVD